MMNVIVLSVIAPTNTLQQRRKKMFYNMDTGSTDRHLPTWWILDLVWRSMFLLMKLAKIAGSFSRGLHIL